MTLGDFASVLHAASKNSELLLDVNRVNSWGYHQILYRFTADKAFLASIEK